MAKRLRHISENVYPTRKELLMRERAVLGANISTILGDAGYKFKANKMKGVREFNEAIRQGGDIKDFVIAAIVENIEYKISAKGNPFYWITLMDDFSSIKVYCSERSYNEHAANIFRGECSVFRVQCKDGFVTFDKCMIMYRIPYKENTVAIIHLPFGTWCEPLLDILKQAVNKTIPPGDVEICVRTYNTGIFISPTIDAVKWIEKSLKAKVTIEDYYTYHKKICGNDISKQAGYEEI